MTTLKFVDEFETMAGNNKVYHSLLRGDRHDTAVWCSETVLYGRYCVTLQCPIAYDFFRCNKPRVDGPLTVYIWEIKKIEVVDGIISLDYSGQWNISDAEWNKFCESGYEWDSIGVSVRISDPASNIEKYEAYLYRGVKE